MRSRRCGWLGLSGVVVCLAITTAGCSDEKGPGCRVASIRDLAPTALTKLADVRLDRAGSGFVLIGTDEKKETVRFATLSETGELGTEVSASPLPARTLGPFFGLTAKTDPGDQLLVVYGVASTTSPGATALQILSIGPGVNADARPLQDPDGKDVVIPAGATAVQVAMGSAASGRSAVIAWGQGTQAAGPEVLLLGADGASKRPNASLGGGAAPWDCLAIVPARSDFGVSRIVRPSVPGGKPSWVFADLKDDGTVTYTLAVDSSTTEMGCPAVAPGRTGYTIAWQNTHGTYFSDVDVTRERINVQADIVRGAVRFGGPDRQPRVACVAAMGRQFGIVYDTSAGPLVDRFDIYGNPQGGSLHLPSRGRPASTSAWPRLDAVFLTYLDRGADPSTDARKLAAVDCPPEF